MRTIFIGYLLIFMNFPAIAQRTDSPRVEIEYGILEGTEVSGVRAFKGIPYAQPPIGDLRWREPQPVKAWEGVRSAKNFGPRAMQRRYFDDMLFRSDGVSEDCLYLNVWTPAKNNDELLPVLVYFYGGGLFTGDGSEFRYDGESMAREGIVTLTVNYRLNVFGFFAHPELSAESPNQVSGNYGFFDQTAALRWIRDNIAAFGGDPGRVTIAGESAGSVSVSAQMASPLSKDLIAGAIGSSGSLMGTLSAEPLEVVEQKGVAFAEQMGATSIEALRALSAEKIMEAAGNMNPTHFLPAIDGYFFPRNMDEIFEAGEQADVPLLLGWNSQEMSYRGVMSTNQPTPENFASRVESLYGDMADEVLSVYTPETEEEVIQAATDLAGDRFTGFSTWKWGDMHARTGSKPVYRYYYVRPRPLAKNAAEDASPAEGATHSAEIEYAMGNLATNWAYDWQPEDFKVSSLFKQFYANFVKTGNPNGYGVPDWPAINGQSPPPIMHIDVDTRIEMSPHENRYRMLDTLFNQKRW